MKSSITANAAAMLAARLLPPVFAFAVHVSVARLAGPETLGAYVNLLAVLMIFQAVAGAGMQFLVGREIAAFPHRASEYARDARAFGLLTGICGTIGYILYASWLLPGQRLGPALALSITVLPSAWIALQESIFVATRTHHWITVVAVVENTVKMVGALAALWTGHGLFEVCIAIALARLAGLATGGVFVWRIGVRGTWRMHPGAVPAFCRAMAPFSILFILSMAYFRIDVPIVQAIAGDRLTGIYGAATTLYGALLLLPESALAALYPRLARACHDSREGYARATWIIAKLLGFGLVPVALALMCAAQTILAVAYGGRFAASAPVLRLLALALPLHALNGALGQALQAGGEQRAMVRIIVFGVAVHVVLLTVFIHVFGIAGAAAAMLVSSSCVAVGALHAVHRRVAPIRVTARVVFGVVTAAAALVITLIAPDAWRPIAGLVGIAALSIGAIRFGWLGTSDLDGMRAAFIPAPSPQAAV